MNWTMLVKDCITARSRNDQVALDIRLYVKEEIIEIQKFFVSNIG